MTGHADIIRRYLDLPGDPYETPSELADAESALDALVAENQQQTEALHRCRDDYHTKVKALVAEHQQLRIELYDLDRRLHAHLSGGVAAENQQLRDALERMDGVARSAISFVPTPYKRAELELRRISASALDGTPSEDTR